MTRNNTVPKKWTKYKSWNNVIDGTRILPFKTPFNGSVGKGLRFTASDLVEQVSNLGFVVNLTKTIRYYNAQSFVCKNIEYRHIDLHGGGEIPAQEDVDRVFDAIDQFIKHNEDDKTKLVGVHCTHGVNRTGYIVCRYMIEKLGFEPKEAIQKFEAGRGHQFDHKELKDALMLLTPSETPLIKKWHSIGGSIQRGNTRRKVDLDLDKLKQLAAGGDLGRTERSSTHVSRHPRISPPGSDIPSGRRDHASRSADRSQYRSRSPARDRGRAHQEFARRMPPSGSFRHYLGPREPLRTPEWPAPYVGPRREEYREYY